MDRKVVLGLVGGIAAIVGVAVALHWLGEKDEAAGGDDTLDIDGDISEIGPIERDQNGMIKWS